MFLAGLVGSNCSVRLSSFVARSFNMEASLRSPPSDMPVGKAAKKTSPPPSETKARPLNNPVQAAALEPVTAGDALLGGAFSESEPTLRKPAAARRLPAAVKAPCQKRVATKRPAADVGIDTAKKWKASMAAKDAKKAEAAKAAKGDGLETADKATADASGQEDMEEEEKVKTEEGTMTTTSQTVRPILI